jgi:hypothetical protein
VVGEGAEFIRAWARSTDEALALPCVLHADGPTATPSYEVEWQTMPLLKVPGHERYYYLAGRGCKGKCSFCATAWVQPHQTAPEGLIRRVISYVADRDRGKLTLVTNDSGEVGRCSVVNAQSVRVRDYLANPRRYKASMLHLGIEGWEEETRRAWGKPVSDEEIRYLIEVTAAERQPCELFFIVGYPGWSMESVRRFGETVLALDNSPQVRIKATYLDPCPHTPLGHLPVEGSYCDIAEVFRLLNGRNKRIRVYPTRSRARSAWRTVLHRCTPEEAVRLGKQPQDTNEAVSWDRFAREIERRGLTHLLTRGPTTLESRIAPQMRRQAA